MVQSYFCCKFIHTRMNLQHRIDLLIQSGRYILSEDSGWLAAKQEASQKNGWFIPGFIDLATKNIARSFLSKPALEAWVTKYNLPSVNPAPKTIGVVMAGNIPLVGFHDFLSVFISGNKIAIKPSSKDETLLKHIVAKLAEWDPEVNELVNFGGMLKGCDAYITTGSNNSSRYFEYYFGKYPHIIRRNRSSVAILQGDEPTEDLEKLADDVYMYFGLGCRNVTKIYVPQGYDFIPLLTAFKKYNYLADHHKYKNNYDYNLAILLLNKKFYMSNESILLAENASIFSPISQLNYEYYSSPEELETLLTGHQDLQCLVGKKYLLFGNAQFPCIDDFADGVNTLEFLTGL
ncbi:MAG: acyl-CoA reductase [Chitinophagaceae bacterium]|nr:acyl-CoA reductase [Chitinophagaceae bacterium]